LEALGLEALKPKTEAVALPVKDFHSVTVAIQKYEKHGIEDSDLYIQLHQGRQAIDRFSKVDGLGIQVHFLDFGVGRIMAGGLQKEIGSTASGINWRL